MDMPSQHANEQMTLCLFELLHFCLFACKFHSNMQVCNCVFAYLHGVRSWPSR